ncbi:MAG: sensor histidine kinase [Dysgonomonas sp.]
MKLSNHLTIRLSGIFILIMLVWSIIYFFFQMTEIYDGIDEGLNNLKQEFIYEANRSPDFVVDMEKHNPLNIIIDKISFEEAKDFKETYTASKVYFITEEEEEEVRMLTTAFFCEQNNQYYKLKIFTSTVESDDLIKSMLYLLIALWVCLALVIILVIKRVIHSSNKPFYQLLHDLKNFKLGDGKMIEFPANNIYEYTELNSSVKDLLEDNINAYNEQKNFIENASHELQTPLSITIGKLELIMNSNKLDQQQLEEMASALNSLNRMKRLNSSLLLLSKIKNKQFSEKEAVDMVKIFEEIANDFEDITNHKEITLTINKKVDTLIVQMNKDLAYILVNNLIKNAVSHNIKKGKIEISIDENSVIITNDGEPVNTDIFERYVSASKDTKSSGLGLSIVKSIVELYKFRITHEYKGKHIFKLVFPN